MNMEEVGSEFHADQPRAKVFKEVEVNGRKLVVLKASPRNSELREKAEGGEAPADVIFVPGHNPKPRKYDEQVRTGYDMSILADQMGCDVYGFVRADGAPERPDPIKNENHPDQVSLTQLHQAKAEEILGAVESLRAKGDLSDKPLDVMGYSDGGVVVMAMLAAHPEWFNHFVITNTPGLDNTSTKESVRRGFGEIVHLAKNAAQKRFGSGRKRDGSGSKLAYTRSPDDDYRESSYKGNSRFEAMANYRASGLLQLLPGILERNPSLRGYVVNTEADRIAPADQVENALRAVPTIDDRVQTRRTGWATHTMGDDSTGRAQKLEQQAGLLLDLRLKS
jgi:pimeloyl-ACP methyl ester carboxylesterase